MKKIASLILVLILLLSLCACGKTNDGSSEGTDFSSVSSQEEEQQTSDSSGEDLVSENTDDTASSSSEIPGGTDTPVSSAPSSSQQDISKLRHYDSSLEHLIVVTDIKNYSIVVIDLDKASSLSAINELSAVVWKWDSQTCPNIKYPERASYGLDDAKLRWSAYYNKYVVIVCSSSGWAGIIDYTNGNLLWEAKVSYGPHSTELLPNGDFMVACSGGSSASNGRVNYYAISQGKGTSITTHYSMEGCHGVCWMPDLNQALIDGYQGVTCLNVNGYGTASVSLTEDSSRSFQFPTTLYAHDLQPVAGTKGTYWVTATTGLFKYNVLTRSFLLVTSEYSANDIKGIASFDDGTVVSTVPGGKGSLSYTWSTCSIRVQYYVITSGKIAVSKLETKTVYFPDREFYKVHTFTKNYQ